MKSRYSRKRDLKKYEPRVIAALYTNLKKEDRGTTRVTKSDEWGEWETDADEALRQAVGKLTCAHYVAKTLELETRMRAAKATPAAKEES